MENSAFRQTALPKILFEAENLHNKVIIVFGKNIVITYQETQHNSLLQCEKKYPGTRWQDEIAKMGAGNPGHGICGSTMPLYVAFKINTTMAIWPF